MTIRSINNTFNRGELDPTLMARDDLDLYGKGARKLRNMVALWTGAAQLASGTTYTDVMVDRENSNAVLTAEFVKGFDFTFDADGEEIYTIIVRGSNAFIAIDIYLADVLVKTITPTANVLLQEYTPAQIQDIYIATGHDRLLILHENVQFKQLKRGATSANWDLTLFAPRVNPTFDFSTISEAPSYQSLTFDTSVVGLIVASGAIFVHNHEGGLFITDDGGIARIDTVTNSTSVLVTALATIPAALYPGSLVSLKEKLWNSDIATAPASENRGWPARGAFYLTRTMLGRSLALKNLVVVSSERVFDNFNDAEVDAQAAFSVSLNAKGEQSIQSIVADDSILFTTTNKIFAQSPLVEAPLSISNVYFAPQSQGSASNIEAVTLDNQVFFVSSNRTKVLATGYSTDVARYVSQPANLLINSIFDKINSNSSWEPEGILTKLYLATQDNGTMLMLSTLRTQSVVAWSLRTTAGKFKQVIGQGKQSHVLVERELLTATNVFEETLDYVYLSDSTFGARYDVTTNFSSATGVSDITVFEDQNDYILIGNTAPYTAIDVDLATGASVDCDLQFEYLDGNGFWDVFVPTTDNTAGFTVDGSIIWDFDLVLNWAPYEVSGIENKFWIRIRRQEATVVTDPIIGHVETNTSARLYLEKQSFDEYMDSVKSTTSDANGLVTGLTHLAGQQVYAIVNGATVGSSFVDVSGQTTIKALSATVKIGIAFKPELVPMPVHPATQTGDSLYSEKYVQDLYIDYVDSLYLQAGFRPHLTDIPNMSIGNYTLGASVPPQTGVYRVCPRGDWQPRQEYVITQSQPGPMTIIGVGYNIEVT